MSERMPTLFVGHGSPMNTIEDNEFTKGWSEIAKSIPKPDAILSVSAHWYIPSTMVTAESSRTIPAPIVRKLPPLLTIIVSGPL